MFNPGKQEEIFAWMIGKFDELKNILVAVGEVDDSFRGGQSTKKFAGLKSYLMKGSKTVVSLSFKEIEGIIGYELCKSAYN